MTKPVEIIFPDTSAMADFILRYTPSSVECNSEQVSLTGCLDEEQIKVALHQFGAVKKDGIMVHIFEPLKSHQSG